MDIAYHLERIQMANPQNDAALKRAVLLSARIRFSPSGAVLREQVIQRILEENLAAYGSDSGLTELEIDQLIGVAGATPLLRPTDVTQAIRRLVRENRILQIRTSGKPHYALAPRAKTEVNSQHIESERKYDAVLDVLFSGVDGGPCAYRKAFLDVLCLIFSRLTHLYVQVITGRCDRSVFLEHKHIDASIGDILASVDVPSVGSFKYAVNRLFRENAPAFNELKWNLAQNFFMMTALGLDTGSFLLSSEMLKGSTLYLDTNVMIAGVTPEHRHCGALRELSQVCKELDVTLVAAQITVDELRSTIAQQGLLLRKVLGKIPDSMGPKVHNFLLEAYLASRKQDPTLQLDSFLSQFDTPFHALCKSLDIGLVDSRWFDASLQDPSVQDLARSLVISYQELRNRPKSENAALHDARLIRWVQAENEKAGHSWIVTLDTTLGYALANGGQGQKKKPCVMTLDAFLHWTAPLCVRDAADEDALAEIYSEALKYQLLPSGQFLTLRDFQIFAEYDIETKQLPDEDVEEIVRQIHNMGPGVDPNKAEDRERISLVMQRVLADPARKYNQENQRLRDELEHGSAEKQSILESLSKNEAEKTRLHEGLKEQQEIVKKQAEDILEANGERKRLKEHFDAAELHIRMLEEQERQRKLTVSIRRRIIFFCLVLCVIMGGAIYTADSYTTGQTTLDRISSLSWLYVAIMTASVPVFYAFLGKDRLKHLMWWKR